jgi:hypothetical protein
VTEHRWSKFWWQDYEGDDALRVVSLAAQGLWMRVLCAMHKGDPHGHLTINGRPPNDRQVAAIASAPEREVVRLLAELEQAAVFSKTADGVIFNRRMVRDKASGDRAREIGKTGGNPALKPSSSKKVKGGGNPGGLTPPLIHQDTEADTESEAESERTSKPRTMLARPPSACATDFDEFWGAYPRKVAKNAARRAYATALRRGASSAVILAGLQRQHWPDKGFTPHPATWLNEGRWTDDPAEVSPAPAPAASRQSNLSRLVNGGAADLLDRARKQDEEDAERNLSPH